MSQQNGENNFEQQPAQNGIKEGRNLFDLVLIEHYLSNWKTKALIELGSQFTKKS